jgi:hypothetical protein
MTRNDGKNSAAGKETAMDCSTCDALSALGERRGRFTPRDYYVIILSNQLFMGKNNGNNGH